MIGRANRLLVVFHDNDRIAEIAKSSQGAEKSLVIALMQSDARLVEHVKNAGQTRADLRGEANTLRFAAGQRPTLAIQGEIAESDLDEKLQSRLDFVQHVVNDGPLLFG